MKGQDRKLAFTEENLARIEKLKSRYPTARAALLPALYVAQEQFGHVSSEAMMRVAEALGIPPIWVFEAATFYTLYHREKPGKTCISVCTSIACFLRGSDELVEYLSEKLKVPVGATTPDGRFTLTTAECLADCDHAPMAMVGEDYRGPLDREAVDRLLEEAPTP